MYNKMSTIYDQLMLEDVDYCEWTDYIDHIFKRYSVDVKSILDLGCGTGNITIPLCTRGYDMTGIDLSEEMLTIADRKAFEEKKSIKWILGNMVDSKFPSTYDAIISCCDSVNYVLEDSELIKMFQNVLQGLKPKGIFTFDMHSYYKISELYSDEVFTYTSDDISYIWENNYDKDAEIIEYYLNFFIKNDKDKYYTRSEEFHYQRAYKSDDVIEMLRQAGFTKIDYFRFKTFEEFSFKDERVQFCAQA